MLARLISEVGEKFTITNVISNIIQQINFGFQERLQYYFISSFTCVLHVKLFVE